MSAVIEQLDRLQKSGLSEEQAKIIVSLNEDTKKTLEAGIVKKADLKKDLALLEKTLSLKIYSVMTIHAGIVLAVLKLWLHD